MRPLLLVFLLLGAGQLVTPAAAQTPDQLTFSYMVCVRKAAAALEPSGDPPQDVARAAVHLCAKEERAAMNADTRQANNLREAALTFGAAEATIARACRVGKRCEYALVPDTP